MVFQIAANHLWQSAILVSAVLMLFATVRGMSAAMRYLLAFAALVAAAMLPMAAWLPRMADGGLSPLQAVWNPAAISNIESASRQVGTPTPLWSDWHLAELSALALSIWCVGVAVGLIRLTANILAAAALARRSICRALPSPFQSLLPLDLRESREVQAPIVIGLLRPCVIVPIGLLDHHDETDLHAVLAHEKSHIDRADPWAALLQRMIIVIFWWNPLLRLLSRHIDESREMACDEAAARRVGDAQVVARALTQFVHQRHCRGDTMHSLGLGGGKALFTRRIRRLMDAVESPSRTTRGMVAVALSLVIAGIVIATPRSQAGTKPQASTNPAAIAPASTAAQPHSAGPSLLSIAIAQQDSDMLRRLIRAGADVRAAEARGERLLLSAVQADNTGMVEALVRGGADAGAAQARGEPVLAEAVARGNSGIARLLLSAGARPD